MSKVCPLFFTGAVANPKHSLSPMDCPCVKDDCAWWCAEYNCCVVLDIAGSLASWFEDKD